MFYAMATGKVGSGLLEFRHNLKEIQSLKQNAGLGQYDMAATSYHAYPYVAHRYILTGDGSSEDGYDPITVARPGLDAGSLAGRRVAVPSMLTTACLALRLYKPGIETVVYEFDRILEVVGRGEVDAGLVIHEGQLKFADTGLRSAVDLGKWWRRTQDLPLTLGCSCILRGVPAIVQEEARRKVSETLQFSLEPRARRWSTRTSSPGGWGRAWRTDSSGCMSTVTPPTWRRWFWKRASTCLTWGTPQT
jgi:1,4-dihydroxy-6-naphthoate synthase